MATSEPLDAQIHSLAITSSQNTTHSNQLQHELAIVREENKLAAEHALDLLDTNKALNEKIIYLSNQITELQETLEVARQQREQIAELGHEREDKLRSEINKLKSDNNLKLYHREDSRSLVNELNDENYFLSLEVTTNKNSIEKLSDQLKTVNKDLNSLRSRETKYLAEITKLEEENTNLQENWLTASEKLSEISLLENEILSQQVKYDDSKRDNESLQEEIYIKEEQLKEIKSAFNREKSQRLNLEVQIKKLKRKQKRFIAGSIQKLPGSGLGGLPPPPYDDNNKENENLFQNEIDNDSSDNSNVNSNNTSREASPVKTPTIASPMALCDTFSLGSSLQDLQVLDSECESVYNLNAPSYSSTPNRAARQHAQHRDRDSTVTNPKYYPLKNTKNLQYELEKDKLKDALINSESEKTRLMQEFDEQEKLHLQQIKTLQTQLKQNIDITSQYKKISDEFSKIRKVLNLYNVKVDDLEEKLEETELQRDFKNNSCHLDCSTASVTSENNKIDNNSVKNNKSARFNGLENSAVEESSAVPQYLEKILSEKSTTIKKLRNIIKQQESSNSTNMANAKQTYNKMINIKTEIINKLVCELKTRKIREKEFKQTKKSFIYKTENWKGVLESLAQQVKEKETDLQETRARLNLVVGQKNKMDGLLLDRI